MSTPTRKRKKSNNNNNNNSDIDNSTNNNSRDDEGIYSSPDQSDPTPTLFFPFPSIGKQLLNLFNINYASSSSQITSATTADDKDSQHGEKDYNNNSTDRSEEIRSDRNGINPSIETTTIIINRRGEEEEEEQVEIDIVLPLEMFENILSFLNSSVILVSPVCNHPFHLTEISSVIYYN